MKSMKKKVAVTVGAAVVGVSLALNGLMIFRGYVAAQQDIGATKAVISIMGAIEKNGKVDVQVNDGKTVHKMTIVSQSEESK